MFRATNPATEEVVRERPLDDAEAVERKLAAAARAYAGWRRLSFAERGARLRAVAERLRADVDRLGAFMTEEMGKPVKEARGEVEQSAWAAEHYAEHAEAYLAPEVIPSDATLSRVQHLPLGPVLAVLPWNAPFWLALRAAAPALMAGNVVLVKHDPHLPGCAEALEETFRAAGLPEGALQALFVDVSAVEGIVRDDRVRAVSFTGSVRGGRALGGLAGSEVKPAVLELGGSDPFVVLADADLEAAADTGCLSRIINAGQSCIAAKRMLVEAPVYDRFLELLQERLGRLKVGDPADPATDVGPIARPELRHEVHRQVRETVEAGARCLLGGELPAGKGYFYPVTLLADVTPDMTAFREETFGPVASVTRVSDAQEALELANRTEYGLGAAVWTTRERGEAMAAEIEAGQVSVNGIVKTDPRLPSGGVKRSGIGRELGPHGIREFVNAQQVWIGPRVT